MSSLDSEALSYHSEPVPGKLALRCTKPCRTQHDLALAYTPGVAKPCLEIQAHPEEIYRYTGRGNTVAVVSDGTAVLGLGNIGPGAGMPVMEGKCVLFKHFADIDAVPLCLSKCAGADGRTDAAKLIAAIETLEPSFGGINLEDIAAPACFEVETTLRQRMGIPVFHDDQHGTAIISLAALYNAAKLTGRRLDEMKVVANGAGAAGLSCIEFYITAGVRRENVVVCDSKGVITKANASNPAKAAVATSRTDLHTLADALKGADLFLGCSAAGCLTPEMVKTMAKDPIIFAMANPVPEIDPALAWQAGAAVVGTGRTDFPNQINNVLGFPGIFRGALDCRATTITEGMQLAAARALAELAELPVQGELLQELSAAYPEDAAAGIFGGDNPLKRQYVIPKPFDPRVVPHVARQVIAAAMAEGVAKVPVADLDAYESAVFQRIQKNL